MLGRQSVVTEDLWAWLDRVDLRNAELDGITIRRACFAHSTLAGASLVGASLVGAALAGTILRDTDLTSARLRDVKLEDVVADHTTLWPEGFSGGPRT